jgi:hypothetical protein
VAAILFLLAASASSAESRKITGNIVDQQGRPVANAAIDFLWSANGPLLDAKGKPRDLSSEEAKKRYWSQFGRMEPVVKTISRADGGFSLQARGSFFTIMALDAERKRGGLATIPKDYDGSPIEIRLQPLVRVQATISSAASGRPPTRITAVVEAPADPSRPLAMPRLVLAEARDSHLLMSLPPGAYVLEASDDQFTTSLRHKFTLKGNPSDVVFGSLTLQPAKPSISQAVQKAQADGGMGDYTKNYGKPLPPWHIVDARGVPKNVQLSDFKGKWVIVHFWALSCVSCLKNDLPRLTKFYEDHHAQRDQFEVVAICVDHNGGKKSMAEVDRA